LPRGSSKTGKANSNDAERPFHFRQSRSSQVLSKRERARKGYPSPSGNKKNRATQYINAINLGEIIYSTKKEFGDQKKLEVLATLKG
jgi:hypothetical protein